MQKRKGEWLKLVFGDFTPKIVIIINKQASISLDNITLNHKHIVLNVF